MTENHLVSPKMTSESGKASLQDIARRVMTTHGKLEWLRSKHSYYDSSADPDTLQNNLAALDNGLDEAYLILELSNYYSKLEAENQLLKLRIKKLEESNVWLSDELQIVQNKLQASEQNVARLEVERNHLGFIADLRGSKEEDEGIGDERNVKSPLDSVKLQDLEQVSICSESSSDSAVDKDSGSDDSNVSAEPKLQSNQQVNAKTPPSQVEVDKLSRSLLVGGEVCPEIRNLRHQVIKYVSQDRLDRAELLCQLCLGKIEDSVGQEDPVYVSALVTLATVHQFQGKFESSVSLLRQALRLRKELLSSTHLSVVDIYNRLALIFIEMGNFEEAEFHLHRALKVKILHFGDQHEDVAKQLKNLAIMYRRQRKFKEAAHYYKLTARIYWDKYGPSDRVAIKAINDSVLCDLKHQKFVKKNVL